MLVGQMEIKTDISNMEVFSDFGKSNFDWQFRVTRAGRVVAVKARLE